MKKLGLITAAAALMVPAMVSAQPNFVYEGIIDVAPADPVAITADEINDSIYFVGFGGATLYEIADPVAATDTSGSFPASPSGTAIDTVLGFGAGRGLQGVAVDSSGNVYIAGDNGGGTPQGIIRKYDNAGTEDATFSSAADAANIRAGGIALLSDSTLAVTQFGGVNYYATADFSATGYTNSSGGTIYAREVQYNPTDNVIYQTRSGSTDATKVAGYYGGGTTGAGNYTWNASALIADGAIDTAFGTATSHGDYDADLGVFFDASNVSLDHKVRVYEVTSSGTVFTLLQTIDGSTLDQGGAGQPFPIDSVADATYLNGYLYVTSASNSGSIYVFKNITGVDDWTMY